jgi:hypothetical protein
MKLFLLLHTARPEEPRVVIRRLEVETCVMSGEDADASAKAAHSVSLQQPFSSENL